MYVAQGESQMYSDNKYLSDGEFYHPDEEKFVENNPISVSASHIDHANRLIRKIKK